MTALASHAALDQSYAALETTGIEEWPMLPGQGAQDLHSPSLEPTAMPRENSACNLMDLPTAIQPHEEGLHETAKGSTEQGMISSEETYMDHHGASEPMTPDTMIKVPDAAQSATEACTLPDANGAARSKRQPEEKDLPNLVRPASASIRLS